MQLNPVFTYIPNLIGYARVFFICWAFQYAFSDPWACSFFYLLGQGLDAVDGVAARHFKQTSEFGVVLDMLTDRMGTLGLFVVLSHLYAAHWQFFTALIVLDVVSHWFQTYAKLSLNRDSHKKCTNPILVFYYSHPALFVFCCGNELFVCLMYLTAWTDGEPVHAANGVGALKILAYASFPFFAAKQFFSVVQLWEAANDIAAITVPHAAAGKDRTSDDEVEDDEVKDDDDDEEEEEESGSESDDE